MFPLYDTNPHRRTPWVTVGIIAVNLVVMLWLSSLNMREREETYIRYGFVPRRISQLVDPKLVVQVERQPVKQQAPNGQVIPVGQPPPVILQPRPAQILFTLVSMMFLHGNWLHFAGNMWFLWIFGNNIEDRLGHFGFPLFYLVSGFLALACQWVNDPGSTIPAIGASGAVAAVLGAYAITFPTARVRTLVVLVVIITVVDLPALIVLGAWFIVQLLNATNALDLGMAGGVAWWAHIGGFVAGMILMPLFSAGSSAAEDDWRDQFNEWTDRFS